MCFLSHIYVFLVDLKAEDIIPKNNKILLTAFELTSIQYILRKRAFLRNEEKHSPNLIGFLRTKTKKWLSEVQAKIEFQSKIYI